MNKFHFVSGFFYAMLLFCILFIPLQSCDPTSPKEISGKGRWSEEKVWDWYNKQEWMLGSNFNPSTSINQLEFWMTDTWDPQTIDRELGWAEEIGMNTMRVYLHNLLWEHEQRGFLVRLDEYLKISDAHGIKTIFVLLDDVWNPLPVYGKQPEPYPHRHNSGWVQAPGAIILGDSSRHDELKAYIKGVMTAFGKDSRVIAWDIYNEPDNVFGSETEIKNKAHFSLQLLKKVVQWAREVNPDQPITSGIWRGKIEHWGIPDSLPKIDRFMIENSDVISFHAYDGNLDDVKKKIDALKKYNRPLMCTEYLARGMGNKFQNVLPLLKKERIAAINWGLVDGKTQTKYPWSSWQEKFVAEPEIWHHDIFRRGGTPYDREEVELIKSLSERSDAKQ